jgi:hypothetical protein
MAKPHGEKPMKTTHVCLLVGAILAATFGTSAAEGEAAGYSITDTRQGAIRMEGSTGKSWLLVVRGDRPAWVPIAEPEEETLPGGPSLVPTRLGINDLITATIVGGHGETLGVMVGGFKRKGTLGDLQFGDIITKVYGKSVGSIAEIRALIRRAVLDKQETVELVYERSGELRSFSTPPADLLTTAPSGEEDAGESDEKSDKLPLPD